MSLNEKKADCKTSVHNTILILWKMYKNENVMGKKVNINILEVVLGDF